MSRRVPDVLLGDTVFWFPGGLVSEAPHAAVVTAIGINAVAVNVSHPLHDRALLKDGVRHVDDPLARRSEFTENGAWCHREDYLTRAEVSDEKKAAVGCKSAREALESRGRAEREVVRRERELATAG